MVNNTGKYRKAARDCFLKFREAFETTDSEIAYWRFGTSFDTMTDYLWLLKNSSDPLDSALYQKYKEWLSAELKKTDWKQRADPYAQYLKGMVVSFTACCYDDFCWWGIASAKALPESPYYHLFLDLFGKRGIVDFQNIALAIWELVYNGNYNPVINIVPKSYPGYDTFLKNYSARSTYHGGSPNAWARVKADTPNGLKDAYYGTEANIKNVEPRFANGMWQYDYYWDPTYPSHPNYECIKTYKVKGTSSYSLGAAKEKICGQDGNPYSAAHCIGPFQLTLMNGLMLVYSSRLHSWTNEPKNGPFLKAATGVKDFLYNWFNLYDHPQPDPKNKLLWKYNSDPAKYDLNGKKAFVRERVGTYKDGTVVPGYDSYKGPRLWCGDQGLILGGLAEYELANGETLKGEVIEELVAGSLDTNGYLFEKASTNFAGSIQSFRPVEDWGCDKLFRLTDYWSGAGIFWRYLFQTFKTHSKVQKEVVTIINKDITNNAIIQSAETALRAPEKPWNPGVPWPKDAGALFEWFNPLATLTSAIYIMENS